MAVNIDKYIRAYIHPNTITANYCCEQNKTLTNAPGMNIRVYSCASLQLKHTRNNKNKISVSKNIYRALF